MKKFIKYPAFWIIFLAISPWMNHFLALNWSLASFGKPINECSDILWIVQLLGLCFLIPACFGAFE